MKRIINHNDKKIRKNKKLISPKKAEINPCIKKE